MKSGHKNSRFSGFGSHLKTKHLILPYYNIRVFWQIYAASVSQQTILGNTAIERAR